MSYFSVLGFAISSGVMCTLDAAAWVQVRRARGARVAVEREE
jgi:hypothetical protein